VPRASIIGKAIVIFWPPGRLRLLDVESGTPTKQTPVKTAGISPVNFSLRAQ
jgi:hypothetical protein